MGALRTYAGEVVAGRGVFVLLFLVLAGPGSGAALQTVRVDPASEGIGLRADIGGETVALLNGLRYEGRDATGTAFSTGSMAANGARPRRLSLSGPGADHVTVTAALTPLPRGCRLEWTFAHDGPKREWNGWTSGFRLDLAGDIVEATTQVVTKWVTPTGAEKWEVAGDTLYPDTECQIRQIALGDISLVVVTPSYDPDWIYGNSKERAPFLRFALPKEPVFTRRFSMALLAIPTDAVEPHCLAAEAAGRPLALSLSTGRTGSLFAPGESVPLVASVRNVTPQPHECHLEVEVHDYDGAVRAHHSSSSAVSPWGAHPVSLRFAAEQRGILFVVARMEWEGGTAQQRATIGVLPDRRAEGVCPRSPFGMAAAIASPERYPDQLDLSVVLRHMERIGVRWVRGGWFPLKSEFTEAEERVVSRRVRLLGGHGILPHVQVGCKLPGPDGGVEELQTRLRSALHRFRWVSPYIEIGNELNHAGVTGPDYVERMLRPVHDVMRRMLPKGRVMSMGLGGVGKEWIEGFAAAGGMELIDILSVHPGCHPRAPEFWKGWRGWVFRSQMLDAMRVARERGDKAVWITEAYAPTQPGRSGLDLRTAADYLVRTYVCSLGLGVKVVEWYQFQDGVWFAQRQRPDDVEYNFGIVYTDLTPKPAYVAYGAMTEQLEGAACVGRIDLGADDLYGVRFRRELGTVDVLWSYREKHETDVAWWPPEKFEGVSRRPGEPWEERWRQPATVELPAQERVTVTDILGRARVQATPNGRALLQLTGSPVYVVGLGDIPLRKPFWPDIE